MLNEVIGQDRAKALLDLKIRASKSSGTKFPSLFLGGRSGNGKTHMALAIARELDAELIYVNSTSVKNPLQFREFFVMANKAPGKHHVLFLDEAHTLNKRIQENLLSVLEEPAILCTVASEDITIAHGGISRYYPKGSMIREFLPRNISFIFASTEKGQIADTILNRLVIIDLAEYSEEEKAKIAQVSFKSGMLDVDLKKCASLANRSKNIRHLRHLCATAVDIYKVYNKIDFEMLDQILGMDSDGLEPEDIAYLKYLKQVKVAGLANIALFLRKDQKEVQHKMEPFLISKGLIQISRSGRSLTEKGHNKV